MYNFELQEQSWYKRRNPYMDKKLKIGNFEVKNFKKENNSYCDVLIYVNEKKYEIKGKTYHKETYVLNSEPNESNVISHGWAINIIEYENLNEGNNFSLILKLVE